MTATTDSSDLLISLPDLALLARVQRPVVSMWRRRASRTALPFPAPAATSEAGRELFDGTAVVEWLRTTGRGNNPDAAADLAAFAVLRAAPAGDPVVFAGLTALLCLSALAGPLPSDAEELLDIADRTDPDDAFLYGEIEQLGSGLGALVRYAHLVAEAAFGPVRALENLLADRFRLPAAGLVHTAVDPSVRDLVARVALGLVDQAEFDDVVFVDPTPGGSDLIVELASRRSEAAGSVAVGAPTSEAPAARLLQRRLRAQGAEWHRLAQHPAGGVLLPATAVVVAQLPSADAREMSDSDVLSAIEEISLACSAGQRAVILGPASALSEPTRDPEVTAFRREILKTDLVRAIVRLPSGLATTRGRLRLALWCLGPVGVAQPGRPAVGALTLTADLANTPLDETTSGDLVTDIVAGLSGRPGLARHALMCCRAVPTSTLQLSAQDLVAPLARDAPYGAVVEHVDRLRTAAAVLRVPVGRLDTPPVLPRQAGGRARRLTIHEALERGAVRVIPGLRIEPPDLAAAVAGLPVLTPAGLDASVRGSSRSIEALVLAERYPGSTLTEPGDVVFRTAPHPAARVDGRGGSVVAFPARVLRLMDPQLVPQVVAADINAQPAGAKAWRGWALRLVPNDQITRLRAALEAVAAHRAELLERQDALDVFCADLVAGVTSGSLDLTPPLGTAGKG